MKTISGAPVHAARPLLAAVIALGCIGCGSFTTGESSNRGSGSESSQTTVENAYIVPRFLPDSCAIQVGDTAELRLTITNNRAGGVERLEAVTTPAAETVRITPEPPLDVPAGNSIAAGQPVAGSEPFTVTLESINDSVIPAHSVDVTFRFQESGDLTMLVPVEACPRQE